MTKNNFILYKDYEEHIKLLSDEQAGQLFKAIFRYVDGRNEVDLDPMTQMAFSFIKANLERDLKKYKERVEIARENGKKGGRPKESEQNLNKPKKPSRLISKPKKGDIVIDTVTVIVNDKDIDIEIIKRYTTDLELTKSIVDFVNHRYSMPKKDRMSNLALQKFLNLLDKYFGNSNEQKILGIEKAIASGWKTVYENKDYNKDTTKSMQEIYDEEFGN